MKQQLTQSEEKIEKIFSYTEVGGVKLPFMCQGEASWTNIAERREKEFLQDTISDIPITFSKDILHEADGKNGLKIEGPEAWRMEHNKILQKIKDRNLKLQAERIQREFKRQENEREIQQRMRKIKSFNVSADCQDILRSEKSAPVISPAVHVKKRMHMKTTQSEPAIKTSPPVIEGEVSGIKSSPSCKGAPKPSMKLSRQTRLLPKLKRSTQNIPHSPVGSGEDASCQATVEFPWDQEEVKRVLEKRRAMRNSFIKPIRISMKHLAKHTDGEGEPDLKLTEQNESIFPPNVIAKQILEQGPGEGPWTDKAKIMNVREKINKELFTFTSSSSGTRLQFDDGDTYKKVLPDIIPPSMSTPATLTVRKLHWLDEPQKEPMIRSKSSKQADATELRKKLWGEGQELVKSLCKAEEGLLRDSDGDEPEDNDAWKGIPEFPASPTEIDKWMPDGILLIDKWRRKSCLNTYALKEVTAAMLLQMLTDPVVGDSDRLRGVATIIRVFADCHRVSSHISKDNLHIAKLHQDLLQSKGLIPALVQIAQSSVVGIRCAGGMLLACLNPDDKAAHQALLDSFTTEVAIDKYFSAILLALCGVFNWKALNAILDFWLPAFRKKDIHLALYALRKFSIHSPVVGASLAEHLGNTNYDVRIKTCLTFPFVKGSLTRDVQSRLLQLVATDWHIAVRIAAARALGFAGFGHLVNNHIVGLLSSEGTEDVMEGLRLVCLLDTTAVQIMEKLLVCLRSDVIEVKMGTLESLARLRICHPKFLTTVCEFTIDTNINLRIAALKTLGRIGNKSQQAQLMIFSSLSHDSEPEVRYAACEAVIQLNLSGEEAEENLGHAYEREKDERVREKIQEIGRHLGKHFEAPKEWYGEVMWSYLVEYATKHSITEQVVKKKIPRDIIKAKDELLALVHVKPSPLTPYSVIAQE